MKTGLSPGLNRRLAPGEQSRERCRSRRSRDASRANPGLFDTPTDGGLNFTLARGICIAPPPFNCIVFVILRGVLPTVKSLKPSVAACTALVIASNPVLAVANEAGEPATVSIFGAYGFWWLLGVAGAVLALRQGWAV